MTTIAKQQLAHILWIGGATDSGKTTIARTLAQRTGFSVYHYDRVDSEQMEILARTTPEIARFLEASLEDRWVRKTPEDLYDFLLFVFPLRFPLVLDALLELPRDKPVIVEGFGLLPELVQPLLSSPNQAIWLVPTEKFKWESMNARGKPSFASAVSDPEKARMNLFTRDRMLAYYYRRQVPVFGYTLFEVDGSRSTDEMTDLAGSHFARYLSAVLELFRGFTAPGGTALCSES